METRTWAADLATTITEALNDNYTTVTIHTDEALNAVHAGVPAILIAPPTVDLDTSHHATATWTITVVPGSDDRETSWNDLDSLLTRIQAGLNIDRAEPRDWQPDTASNPLIAYQLTITTDHDL